MKPLEIKNPLWRFAIHVKMHISKFKTLKKKFCIKDKL